MVMLKSIKEISIMDDANSIVHKILLDLCSLIKSGISTLEIDNFVEQSILKAGGLPAFKNYPHFNNGPDFPGSICTSINDEVIHGIPRKGRILQDGDILSVDLGVLYKGYYGDGAKTYPVGIITPEAQSLLDVTQESLFSGIKSIYPGGYISDIGFTIQSYVEANGFSVVREFVGHGIGTKLHEEPQVPNFGQPGLGIRLIPGMVLAIEPMVNAGKSEVILSTKDYWTVYTKDKSLSAHFELCVAITNNGPKVLGNF